jgi:hypothetical protein
MIKLCADYLRITLFCSGLLIGIQIPAVVDQYAKRIDAHLTEALNVFSGFQQTADRYFEGNIQNLLNHYRSSDDPVFKNDATNILFISDRVSHLKSEQVALEQSALMKTAHVLLFHDDKIFQQTLEQYSYMILINPQALIWGLISGFLMASFCDLLFYSAGYFFRYRKNIKKYNKEH